MNRTLPPAACYLPIAVSDSLHTPHTAQRTVNRTFPMKNARLALGRTYDAALIIATGILDGVTWDSNSLDSVCFQRWWFRFDANPRHSFGTFSVVRTSVPFSHLRAWSISVGSSITYSNSNGLCVCVYLNV